MVRNTSKLAAFPVSLPTTSIAADIDVQSVAKGFSDFFTRVTHDSLYVEDAAWRDTFCLTGTLRTFYSPKGIVQAFQRTCSVSAAPVVESLVILSDQARRTDFLNGGSWIDVIGVFSAKTQAGLTIKALLMISVVPGQDDDWKIWQMRTIMTDVEGWPTVNDLAAQDSVTNGYINRQSPQSDWTDVVVVGGGASGLSAGGRLQALGVEYVLLDKYEQIGDSWGTRYDSVKLHTPREYAQMPFERTFSGSEYPEYLPKDDLARGHQGWAKKYGVDKHVWVKSELISGSWDDASQSWMLKINRNGADTTLKCRFVVMATGPAGQVPHMPDLPGKEAFKGIAMHSQRYKNAHAWKGKGVVIGSANTAHDVVEDMYEAGLETTMIQRSPSVVLPGEYWKNISDQMYNAIIPTDVADTIAFTGPLAITRYMFNLPVQAQASMQPERFDALTRVGFANERFGDLGYLLFERGGGHFMDMGVGQMIVDGKIKMESRQPVHYTESGLLLSDGSELPADVIIWATGYNINIRQVISKMFGKNVSDEIEDFWGPDDEGELRGVWKIQHPGLVVHGAELGQGRFFSKYVALQIKAALEGKPFKQYRDTPVLPKLSSY